MSLDETIKKPLRRLNPYRGLVIDVPTWSAAHDYHNTQRRLHAMGMHRPGIVTGLEVVGWNPPDGSVVIYPGVAVDHEGHTIIVSEAQRFEVQTGVAGTLYLVIQYREVSDEMAHTGEGEEPQAVYILEAYRLDGRMDIPAEDHIELARIKISGKGAAVVDAQNAHEPLPDEIDLRHRTQAGSLPLGDVAIGLVPLETTSDGDVRHQPGAVNLIRNINAATGYHAEFKGLINLNQEIRDCNMLLLAGQEEFTLTEAWEGSLRNYLDRGGIMLGETCGAGESKADRESPFQRSFREMADRLGRPLAPFERRHPVLAGPHLFAEPPEGIDGPGAMFGDSGIIYSDGDYGCLWDGGRPEKPASRPAIRSAVEIGINLAVYSYERTHSHSVRMVNRRSDDSSSSEDSSRSDESKVETDDSSSSEDSNVETDSEAKSRSRSKA